MSRGVPALEGGRKVVSISQKICSPRKHLSGCELGVDSCAGFSHLQPHCGQVKARTLALLVRRQTQHSLVVGSL